MNKNSIPVLGIPHLNRWDLLRRCLASIDYPVEKLVIVDQGPHGLAPGPRSATSDLIKEIHILRHPNAGVAGAWNEIIKLFPAKYWMLVNDDMEFAPGDLEKMERAARFGEHACYYANHGASFWVVTEYGIEMVGLFDENIFPAYLEDCDWSYRADLAGVARVNVPEIHAVHGDGKLTGSCTVNATPELQRANAITHSGNFDYYKKKWGGINGEEKFKTPFNQPGRPVWAWQFSPLLRTNQARAWGGLRLA